MGRRQREWAKRAHRALISELGGKCVDCGTQQALELDHLEPRCWDLETREWSWRISIYRRESREGKLTVRCRRCNAVRGEPDVVPF